MPGKHNDHNFYLFLEKNEKCLELLDLARKLIEKSFETNLPPAPQQVRFEKEKKCLELPDLARKLIRKSFQKNMPPTPPKKVFKKKF